MLTNTSSEVTVDHGAHIAGHLGRLKRHLRPEQIQTILDTAKLTLNNGAVRQGNGLAVDDVACRAYVSAVENTAGPAIGATTRANFVLLGCSAHRL